jgi:hypothetical protein
MLRYLEQREEEKQQREEKKQEQLNQLFAQLPTSQQQKVMEKALRKLREAFPTQYKSYKEQYVEGVTLEEMGVPLHSLVTSFRNKALEEFCEGNPSETPLPTNHSEQQNRKTPSGFISLGDVLREMPEIRALKKL